MVVGKIDPPEVPLALQEAVPSIKDSVFNGPIEPGFELPSAEMQSYFWPEDEIEPTQALDNLRQSVASYESEGPLSAHPIFGEATKEQTHNLLMNHAAMHLSFVHPA